MMQGECLARPVHNGKHSWLTVRVLASDMHYPFDGKGSHDAVGPHPKNKKSKAKTDTVDYPPFVNRSK